MTNPNSQIRKSIPQLATRALWLYRGQVATIAICYSIAGYVWDKVPFPGIGLIHDQAIQNEAIKVISPSGNSDFVKLDLKRDIKSVPQDEIDTAQAAAGSDRILDKNEIKAICTQIANDPQKVAGFNKMLVDLKGHKIEGIRASSWNVNGCSEKVSN